MILKGGDVGATTLLVGDALHDALFELEEHVLGDLVLHQGLLGLRHSCVDPGIEQLLGFLHTIAQTNMCRVEENRSVRAIHARCDQRTDRSSAH